MIESAVRLAFGQLKASLAAVHEAAKAASGESSPLQDVLQLLEATPSDRSDIRAALSACQDALERCEDQFPQLSGGIRQARHELGDAWRAFTEGASPEDAALEAAHARAFDWYKQADAKAQAILAFTGVFLAILLGSVVLKADTLLWKPGSPTMNVVGVGIVLILYLAGAFCCVLALWARGMGRSHAGIYFFGNIAAFPEDGAAFLAAIRQSGANRLEDQETRAQTGTPARTQHAPKAPPRQRGGGMFHLRAGRNRGHGYGAHSPLAVCCFANLKRQNCSRRTR